jgi:hypothetical protein
MLKTYLSGRHVILIKNNVGRVLVTGVLLIALCSCAIADRPVNATPEIQGITTSDTIQAQGTVTRTDSLAWTLVNQGQVNTIPIGDQVIQYSTVYNDNTAAVSGQTTLVKSMSVSTGNRIAGQSNVKTNTDLQFIAIDTGRVTRSEDILIDGVGNATPTASSVLCPFASAVSEELPRFCNIVQAGSTLDATLISLSASADDRFVAASADIPVALNYAVSVKGITIGTQSAPAMGSVSGFFKVHLQQARNGSAFKSQDLVYSETASASGLISGFAKSMGYNSGIRTI